MYENEMFIIETVLFRGSRRNVCVGRLRQEHQDLMQQWGSQGDWAKIHPIL